MSPSGLVDLLFPFFGLIAIGVAAARLARLPEAGLAWMQVFIVYVALPCLFFRLISTKPLDELMNWRFVAVTTACTASAFGLSYLAAIRSGLDPAERVMAGVAGSYSNIGYMGPPMVISLLGGAASAPVALVFVFDTILLFSLVPALMAQAGREREPPLRAALTVVRRVVTHPFLMATAAGIAASALAWRPPVALDTMVGWLSGAAAPCALFVLGVTVALRAVRRIEGTVWPSVGIKLVIHPLLVWAVLLVAGGFDPVWVKAATVMAALPPALNIFVLASQYGVGVERASAGVLVGTLLSIATLSGFIWLLESGVLPTAGWP